MVLVFGVSMSGHQIRLCILFAIGCAQVLLRVAVLSLLMFWALQLVAQLYGEIHDWRAVLSHIMLSLTFLAFFPGQRIWTHRIQDRNGFAITIIGRESSTG